MATTTFVLDGETSATRRQMTWNIDAEFTASNDVLFTDGQGNEVNVPMIQVSANATIVCRKANETKKIALYFAKGGWHVSPAAQFYYSGSTASSGARVRFD